MVRGLFRRSRRLWAAPVSRVAGGSAIGQLAMAASLPLIARLYEAEDVGSFAVALSISQLASIIITGRAEQILPRADPSARWRVVQLILVTSIAGIPAMLLVAGLVDLSAGFLGLIALTFATCLFNLSGFALLARNNFSGLARSRGLNGVATAGLQVVGGLVAPSVEILCVTYAIGSLIAASMCWADLRSIRAESVAGFADVARRERLTRFVLSVAPSGLLSNAALALPTFGIAGLFGLEQAASFFLARRLLMVPSQLIARSISDVNYAELARRPPAETLDVLQRWLRGFQWPALAIVVVGFTISPLLPLLVGRQYPHVGLTMAILVVPSAIQMVAVSFSNIMIVMEREYLTLTWNAARVAGLLGLYALFVERPDYVVDLALYGAYLILIYAALLWLVFTVARRRAVDP